MINILQYVFNYQFQSSCDKVKTLPQYISYQQVQYCLETFYQDYRNITVNIENPSIESNSDVSIFIKAPRVNSLNLTVNSNINVNSLQLAKYIQEAVNPLQITYNIADSSTVNSLYCLSYQINQSISIKQLILEININNQQTQVYLLQRGAYANQKGDVDGQEIQIDQLQLSGIMYVNDMNLMYIAYIPITINQYIFNGYIEFASDGYLGPHHFDSSSNSGITINQFIVRGGIICNELFENGTQNILYKYNDDDQFPVVVNNLEQNLAGNVPYIYSDVLRTRPTITINTPFEFSDTQNNIKYCLPDVIFFTGVNIIVPEINIQETGSYSLFNQLDQDLIDVKVTYGSVNVQHGVFSGLAASINQDVSINNINFNIIAQSISEESGDGKIFTITGDYNGQSISISQSTFNISISRSSQFTYNGLMNQFINTIQLNTVTYNLSITGNNHPSILFADTLDSSTQFKQQSLTMNLYTDNLLGDTSFYLFSSYNGDVQEQQIISISMTSYRNISVNKYQLEGQEQYEGMIDITYLQPTIELTNDNIICEGVVCYYIDNDYLVNYEITGELNTQGHTEQQLYLFKQSVDLTGVSIDLQIDISQSSFNQFQIFQQNQQNTSMVDMKLTLTLGNTIFNGLFGIVNNNISFTCNKYELTVTGNNSIYGIFESQQEEVEASVSIDIDEYIVDITVSQTEGQLNNVAGICNTVSQQLILTINTNYTFNVVSDPQKASVYFVDMNTNDITVQIQDLIIFEGNQQCPYINEPTIEITIDDTQFKCQEVVQATTITISGFPNQEVINDTINNYYAVDDSQDYNNSQLLLQYTAEATLSNTYQSVFKSNQNFIGVNITSSEHTQAGTSGNGFSLLMGCAGQVQIQNCNIQFVQDIGSSDFTGLIMYIQGNINIENLIVQGSVQAQNANFLCYQLTGENISLINVDLSGSFNVQGNSFVLYEYAKQASLTVEGLTSNVNINSSSTGQIGYCEYTEQSEVLMAEISLSGNLIGSDGNASIFISVFGSSSLGISNMSSQEMSIQSSKIVCGLVANLTQSDLDIEGITLTTTIISQHWSTAVFVVFSDSGSTITSSNVSYSTNSKTYGACPVSTVSEQSLTADSYTCPEFVSYTETRDYSDLSGSECENCNISNGRYQHYVYTADENVNFNDTIFTHYNNTDVLQNEYPTTNIISAPFDHTFFGTWLQNLLITGERAYDADFQNTSRDNHVSSLFAGLKDGKTIFINVTTNDTVYEKYRASGDTMDLRYKGGIDTLTSSQTLYFVGCHINTTIMQNEDTTVKNQATFNWGGSLGYTDSTNVHFINHKIGLRVENKRGNINLYSLAYRLPSTYCHSYGEFVEDSWAYTDLKPTSSSTTSYTSACPEEELSYFL